MLWGVDTPRVEDLVDADFDVVEDEADELAVGHDGDVLEGEAVAEENGGPVGSFNGGGGHWVVVVWLVGEGAGCEMFVCFNGVKGGEDFRTQEERVKTRVTRRRVGSLCFIVLSGWFASGSSMSTREALLLQRVAISVYHHRQLPRVKR